MSVEQKKIAVWVLVVSALFSIMEFMVSISLYLSPESILETVDLSAKGVSYVVNMWAARQFALAVIFGYATYKKSIPMLSISYLFFFVMFIGDLIIGIMQNEMSMVLSAIVMCIISIVMIYFINRKK